MPNVAPYLIDRVYLLQVQDDTEILWNNLPDSSWNIWTGRDLQRRWRLLKEQVDGFEKKAHRGGSLQFY